MAQGVKDPSPAGTVSPTAGDSNSARLLEDAMKHFRAGRLEEAKAGFQDVQRVQPKSSGAVHFLGLIAHQEGDHKRAVELLEQAITMSDVVPFFHGNLAEVYRALGRHEDAIAASRHALEMFPVYPEALNTLGAALYERGELEEAETSLRRAIEFKPDMAAAHANLGNVLRAQGRLDRAVKSFEQAIRRDPKLPGTHLALGGTLRALGRLEEAVQAYRKGLDLDPRDAKVWSNLGMVLRSQDKMPDAMACFEKAVELQPGLADTHANLGTALLAQDRLEEAIESYDRALRIKRAPRWTGDASRGVLLDQDASLRLTTPAKLRHDLEQYRYLVGKGRLPEAFGEQIARHEEVLAELDPAATGRIVLSAAQRAKIAGSYNRMAHLAEGPALEPGPIEPGLDAEGIQDAYFETAPGMALVDGLLTPDALEALRDFCLESTIWFDFERDDGSLCAHLREGLGCGLLIQLAEDLRRTFPRVLADHGLRQMWARKYGGLPPDGALRHDAAAVCVKLWITPDAANLTPDAPGLVVYRRELPPEVGPEVGARDQAALVTLVEGSDKLEVPYRQNRAVLFNSNLVYGTGAPGFRDGYENRRIDITFLFGRRGEAAGG